MGFMDKVKNMIGIEDEYYDEEGNDEYYNRYEDSENDEYAENFSEEEESKAAPAASSYRESSGLSRNSNIVNMAGSMNGKMKISIQEPLTYDDGPSVIDHISSGRTVVLNLEMLEVDKKRQIFDFVSGGVYALSGDIQKVTKDIYVIVPKGVQVDGKIADTVAQKSMYQL